MKKLTAVFLTTLLLNNAKAQPTLVKDVLSFYISGDITPVGDSIVIVKMMTPDGDIAIPEKKAGLLMQSYQNGGTDTIGWGRCQSVKGDYCYFSIKLKDKQLKPKVGDLLYAFAEFDIRYRGLFYQLTRHQISLVDVNGSSLSNNSTGFFQDSVSENELINTLVGDIHFTGEAMASQKDAQDQLIKGGRFDGKKLFATMNIIQQKDVIDFIKYMIARPRKYAGGSWKISEIFATWMVSDTPTVID